ncbi:hypothetical protein EG329_010323 [Mollisiaceae sp. DMI_Dod_QoI]|nr:hypothetical protein EG329_010323 [Helotiales sp. DMI_Dod_QoI]
MTRTASYVVYKYDLHSPCGHLVSSPVGGNFTQNVPGEHNIRITAVENTMCPVCTGTEEMFFLSELLNKFESGRESRQFKMVNRCPEQRRNIHRRQFQDAKAISDWDCDISHIKGIIEGIKNQADTPIASEVIQTDFESERGYFMSLREEKLAKMTTMDEHCHKIFLKEHILYNDVKFVNDILAHIHGVYIGRQ